MTAEWASILMFLGGLAIIVLLAIVVLQQVRQLRLPSGYRITKKGIIVPESVELKPVPASKIQAGLQKARGEIKEMLNEIIVTMTESYVITEIELAASFDAQGKFLGFGVGGAASITIRVQPERLAGKKQSSN
jgi:hypothetical protein